MHENQQWRRLREWLDGGELPRTPPRPCPYLPGHEARERAFLAESLHPDTYHELMDRGFRRSGTMFYAADCDSCRRCVPIRVPVATFTPSRSQRRAWRKNADVHVSFGDPEFTMPTFELYRRYLRSQHDRDDADDESPSTFHASLYARVVDTLEVTYSLGDRVVGKSLLDVCSRSVSAVYHFFDPEFGKRSLGVFSVLAEIEWTKSIGVPHYYLGYWIEGSKAMSYKANYRPHELLVDGRWQAAADPVDAAGDD